MIATASRKNRDRFAIKKSYSIEVSYVFALFIRFLDVMRDVKL